MTELGDRHAGTLDGKLTELGDDVTIVKVTIEPDAAHTLAVQHTAWMLINLLARLDGVVSVIHLDCTDTPVGAHVIPLAPDSHTLQDALLAGASSIGAVPTIPTTSDAQATVHFRIGPGGRVDQGWRVYGEGFCGAISRGAIDSTTCSSSPIGPYIAACLAASETFRAVRMAPDRFAPTDKLSYSAWDHSTGAGTIHTPGPPLPPTVPIEFGLAGVGAVGCALLHAVWASPEVTGRAVLADSDEKGVEISNLNRCVIFGREQVGMPKASAATDILASDSLALTPVDGAYAPSTLPYKPPVLVSAVDTNHSRKQVQQGFWPARLLAASTKDLRAEVLRCGPPGLGPCLSCFNPPEADIPDNIRREQLRAMSQLELETLAQEIGHPPELVRRWATEGSCGEVGDAVLAGMRHDDEQAPMFAVGFVSVLAGTLLAAELMKEHIGRPEAQGDEQQSIKFQFERPCADHNGRAQTVQRDPACPACAPDQVGPTIWRKRASTWRPPNA